MRYHSSHRRAGVTLVELLIAIGLTILVVGIVAGISVQVQKSIGISTAREDAARIARSTLNDIERDLASMLPLAKAPPPYPQGTPLHPLEMANSENGEEGRDRLRIFTSFPSPDPLDNGALTRGFVEYYLSPLIEAKDAPLRRVGDLHRHIVSYVQTSTGSIITTDRIALTPTNALDQVIATNVMRMDFDYFYDDDGPNGPNLSTWFQPEDEAAGTGTDTGEEFGLEGQVSVTYVDNAADPLNPGTRVQPVASDPVAVKMLSRIQVGDELWIQPAGVAGQRETSIRLLVRKRAAGNVVFLNDRLNFTAALVVQAARFDGPEMIRARIKFAFGKGPDAPEGVFSRAFAVPQ